MFTAYLPLDHTVTALCALSLTGIGKQVSVFFSRAKTATVMGVLLLFGSIFPYVGVSGPSYSYSAKVTCNVSHG